MGRLYSDYRGANYFKARRRAEPWYTLRVNSANYDISVIQARRKGLVDFLESHLPSDRTDLVVADLGGDAGQFIPEGLARSIYLVEASNHSPYPGVQRVASLSEVPCNIDLLVCAHVLEHLPKPRAFIADIMQSERLCQGSLLYLEVPLERYRISSSMGSRIHRHYLLTLLKLKPAMVMIDFLSVLARSYLGFLLPPLIIKMHEHVNFFTEASFEACLQKSDFRIIACRLESGGGLSTHQGVIRLLARKE